MPGRDRTIADIPRAARENIRIALREKGGAVGCEMRIAASNARGTMIETSRGLRIPLGRLRSTIAALQEAERLAVADGLLPDTAQPGDGRATR